MARMVGTSVMGMSLVVMMVGQATLLPALQPTYGIPSFTRTRNARTSSVLYRRAQQLEGVAAAHGHGLSGLQCLHLVDFRMRLKSSWPNAAKASCVRFA